MLTNKGWVDGNGSNSGCGFGKLGCGRETRGDRDGLEGLGGQLSMKVLVESSILACKVDYGDGEVRFVLYNLTKLQVPSSATQLDHVDELVLDKHVGFTFPLHDRLLSKGLRMAKHPLKHAPSLPQIPIDHHQLIASPIVVLDMIKSFPRGTSCGRDGLRDQHLMDCLSSVVVANSDELVSLITQLVNLFLDGKCSKMLDEYIASALLTLLVKPRGGINPIVMGTVCRRLVSKVSAAMIGHSLDGYLNDLQFGVRVSGGGEAILHKLNRLIEDQGDDVGLSTLFVDFKKLLDPLVFKIRDFFNLSFHAWYIDDGTIIRDTLVVGEVLKLIMEDGPRRGLHLNVDKTKVFWPKEDPRSRFAGVFPPHIARPMHGVKLLGMPASADFDFSSELVMMRVSKSIKLMDAVAKINNHQLEALHLTLCIWGIGVLCRPALDNILCSFNVKMETGILSNPVGLSDMCYAIDLGVPLFSILKPCSSCSKVYAGDIYGDHVVSCAGIVHIKDCCVKDLTAKGVGLRLADSRTSNHHEDGFTPLETIRRFLGMFGSISYTSLKGRPSSRRGGIQNPTKIKLPPQIEENPMFQHLGRYPTSVRVFLDPIIVGGKEMSFRNFMYANTNEDLSFLLKEPSLEVGTGSPSASINTEPPIVVAKTTEQLVENTTDSGGLSSSRKACNSYGKCGWEDQGKKVLPPKLTLPFVAIFNDDEAARCHCLSLKHTVIAHPAWKGHLDNQLDLELFDLHDCCYAMQAIVDNSVNRRSRELLKVVEQINGECEVLKDKEKSMDQECKELRVKCEAVMKDFDKNPDVVALCEKIVTLQGEVKDHRANLDKMLQESQKWVGYQVSLSDLKLKFASLEDEKAKLEFVEASLRQELKNAKLDRAEVVSKVVPYVATELEVAKMKEPFDITKVKGYRSSYKQEHTKAGNDLATATFSYLADFVADPYAPIEVLLSKKPRILQHSALTRTHVPTSSAHSQKATPSPPLMSPPPHITPLLLFL
ncbi:hypothetical protein Tco_0032018 [Tanacetum coccineum]